MHSADEKQRTGYRERIAILGTSSEQSSMPQLISAYAPERGRPGGDAQWKAFVHRGTAISTPRVTLEFLAVQMMTFQILKQLFRALHCTVTRFPFEGRPGNGHRSAPAPRSHFSFLFFLVFELSHDVRRAETHAPHGCRDVHDTMLVFEKIRRSQSRPWLARCGEILVAFSAIRRVYCVKL